MKSTRRLEPDEEDIVHWISLPKEERDRSPLSPKKAERYERANVADNLIREFMSIRTVMERLMEKYHYSDSTARRDILLAQALWGSRNKLDKEYAGSMLWDYAVESMVRAGKEKNWSAVARLLKEAREIAGLGKPDDAPMDLEDLRRPILMLSVYRPDLVGGEIMTDEQRIELRDKMLAAKRNMGYIDAVVITDQDNQEDGRAD